MRARANRGAHPRRRVARRAWRRITSGGSLAPVAENNRHRLSSHYANTRRKRSPPAPTLHPPARTRPHKPAAPIHHNGRGGVREHLFYPPGEPSRRRFALAGETRRRGARRSWSRSRSRAWGTSRAAFPRARRAGDGPCAGARPGREVSNHPAPAIESPDSANRCRGFVRRQHSIPGRTAATKKPPRMWRRKSAHVPGSRAGGIHRPAMRRPPRRPAISRERRNS